MVNLPDDWVQVLTDRATEKNDVLVLQLLAERKALLYDRRTIEQSVSLDNVDVTVLDDDRLVFFSGEFEPSALRKLRRLVPADQSCLYKVGQLCVIHRAWMPVAED